MTTFTPRTGLGGSILTRLKGLLCQTHALNKIQSSSYQGRCKASPIWLGALLEEQSLKESAASPTWPSN